MPAAGGIYYSVQGVEKPDQPDVILLHGAGVSHQVWPAEIRRLPGWHVLAVDLPGHGQSAGPGFQSIEALAGDIAAFMDALHLNSAVLAGHHLGGAAALAFACQNPGRACGLALFATAARLTVPNRLASLLASPSGLDTAASLFVQVGTGSNLPPRNLQRFIRLLAATRPGVLRSDLLACAAFHIPLERSAIFCPTLLMTGSADPFVSVAHVRQLAWQIPNCSLQVLEGVGHLPMLEQPGRCASALKAFLEEKVLSQV